MLPSNISKYWLNYSLSFWKNNFNQWNIYPPAYIYSAKSQDYIFKQWSNVIIDWFWFKNWDVVNIWWKKVNLDIKNISDFFETIKSVHLTDEVTVSNFTLKTENLRKDEVKGASDEEKELILKIFPQIQGRYLGVPKVI